MPLLTIDIPNEGVWNATTCDALTCRRVVLENFRIVPFESGTVRIRTTPCDTSFIHLEMGTPVTLASGDPGVVVMLDATTAMIERTSDGVAVLADIGTISYRMKTSIDDLATSSAAYTTRTFHG